VTSASGDLAEAVGGVLREAYPDAKLFGIDAKELGPASVICDVVEFGPYAYEEQYCEFLTDYCARNSIDFVIPCLDQEIIEISKCPDLRERLNIIMPRSDLVSVFADKLKTAQWLTERNLPAPDTWLLSEAPPSALPLVVKPRRGSGSANVQVVRSTRMLDATAEEFGDDYVAQRYIGTDETEFTCPLITFDGEVRQLILRRALLMGRTVRATVEENRAIAEMLDSLAKAAMPEGPLNVQLRLDKDDKPWIFEINARFSSTVKMRHALGFSDLQWIIDAKLGKRIPQYAAPYGYRVMRMSREIVLPDMKAKS